MRFLAAKPAVLVLALFLGGCGAGLFGAGPLTSDMELAQANGAAAFAYDQAVEARLDGFISDEAWACIKQLQPVIDAALDAGDLNLAQSQTRLLRRAAREDFNACG